MRIDFHFYRFPFMSFPVPRFEGRPCAPEGGFYLAPISVRLFYGKVEMLSFGVPKHRTVMADRLAQSRQVYISAIRSVPRIERAFVMLARHISFVIPTPDARLADLIHSGPYEIPDDIRIVLYFTEVFPCIVGVGFGLHHDA